MASNYHSITPVANTVPFDNSTNGFTATNVQSAIEEARFSINNSEAKATAGATASTGADTLLDSMTLTPVAGTYLVLFSTDITSGTAGAAITVTIYVGGVQKADSIRKVIPFSGGTLNSGSGRGCVSINGLVTVTGSQAIEIRWSSSNSGPTCGYRTMNLVRVG